MYYEIPEYKFERFEKELKKLEEKCRKYNCDFHYSKGEKKLKEFEQDGKTIVINVIPVEVDAKAVQNGWKYVASIEHYDTGNIILSVDDTVEIPEKYRTIEGVCEHCNTKRDRKFTVLLQNIETKELKQVGRQCVMEYTNGLTPAMLKQLESVIDLIETSKEQDKTETVPYEEILVDVLELWTTSYNVINKYGYWEKKPKERKSGYSTVDRVVYLMNNTKCQNTRRGEAIQQWLLENKGTGIDIENYKTLARERFIRTYDIELAIKAANYYRNSEKYQERRLGSEWQGEVGSEVKITVKKTRLVSTFDDKFKEGQKVNLYEFTDTDNNIYIWFTHKNTLETGDRGFTLIGEVKRHEERGGVKKTVLAHCRTFSAYDDGATWRPAWLG